MALHLKRQEGDDTPAQTIMNVDYTDDIPHLANISTQAESLLHSLEQAAGGIGIHVNADKTECMCFNQRGNISILKWTSSPTSEAASHLWKMTSICD